MLADGQVMLLVLSQSAVTDETNHMIDAAVAKLVQSVSEEPDDRSTIRSLIRSDAADGDPQFWDVAVMPGLV
jgi:hypothetical protein